VKIYGKSLGTTEAGKSTFGRMFNDLKFRRMVLLTINGHVIIQELKGQRLRQEAKRLG